MAYITNSEVIVTKKIIPRIATKLPYEIPQRYRDSFYLANAAFFDSTNWFLHRAYEVIFPILKTEFKQLERNSQMSNDEVADKLENMVNVLDQCNSVIDVRFPIKKDNGSYEVIRGFRAHHGLATGYKSCLGGLRINENITRDHMKALSVLSTYRNACMGINMGGAHGGIKLCPSKFSENELQNIVEQYATELIQKGYCGMRDVIQPDINTSEREMSWISKSYTQYTGQTLNAAAVGKSQDYGGFENYDKMSSQGALFALEYFLNNEILMKKICLSVGLKDKTFIIQGLGKLGTRLAELLVSNGAICVGVKEYDAYIYNSKGVNLKELLEHKRRTGSIKDFDSCKADINDNIYTEPCDILIFAAYQKSLICYVANNVKAKIIVEAADGPLTPCAHKILTDRSKLVIPDIYACSGATIISYLEYLRTLQELRVLDREILRYSGNAYENALNSISVNVQKMAAAGSSIETFNHTMVNNVIVDLVENILSAIGNEIVNLAELHRLGTDVRTAAYIVAIKNIFKALYSEKKFT